ncbi:MAG: hypothetical protein ABJN42_13295, partial [Roseibium sp.]
MTVSETRMGQARYTEFMTLPFLAAFFFGLSSRGLHFGDRQIDTSSSQPASNDAERLKQGVPDGIIG